MLRKNESRSENTRLATEPVLNELCSSNGVSIPNTIGRLHYRNYAVLWVLLRSGFGAWQDTSTSRVQIPY